MKTCDVCTLEHHDESCPNGFRNGEPRDPALHELARHHVVASREARARLGH